MVSDDEGFWYPSIDLKECIDCGLCDKLCPIIHKWKSDEDRSITAMAAVNKNEAIRLNSSSGGIFTLIAEVVLNQGGVVFGAAFADDFRSVHHICVDDYDNLDKLRGSKYVQSCIGDTYKMVKDYLDIGRKVLFTGTPCQIGGLYSFLRKPYDNLYTQDIICHGVPSPMVWEKYLKMRMSNAKSTIKNVSFRHKTNGWKTPSVLIEYVNNTAYEKNYRDDPFIRAFLSNICLRPSCYNCSFKGIKRQSDITLADFWGVQNVLPNMDDDKGISLILLHSLKGKELVDRIEDNTIMEFVDVSVAEIYNSASVYSVPYNKNRSSFLMDIKSDDFESTVRKYTKIPLIKRVRGELGRIKRTLLRK